MDILIFITLVAILIAIVRIGYQICENQARSHASIYGQLNRIFDKLDGREL